MNKITLKAWSNKGYMIFIDSNPVGMIVTEKNGKVIKEWLSRAGLSSINNGNKQNE